MLIELEESLVHGQIEVTFMYEGVEYTAELSEAYIDPEVDAAEKLAAAIAAAEEAIVALPTVEEVAITDKAAVADAKALVEAVKALNAEAVVEGEEVIAQLETRIAELEAEQSAEEALATATEAVEVAEASELQADVDAALVLVNALPEGEAKDALAARIAVVQEVIDERVAAEEALATATEAVVVAEESLLEADLAAAQELVTALDASDARTLLQARINSVQLQINGIIAAVNAANTEVKLYNALNVKPFVNVNIDNITAYDTAITGPYTTIAAIQAIIDTVNATAVDGTVSALVTAADAAVGAAEADPDGLVAGAGSATLIATAQEAINVLPTEVPETVAIALSVSVTVKADLQGRLEAVKTVVPVLEAINQVQLLAALQNSAFVRVNEDLIGEYDTALDGSEITITAIQTDIDNVNQIAATTAVGDAEASLLAADVAAAQVLVNNLPDLNPNTAKETLLDRLDVVNAVITLKMATTEAQVLAALKSEALGLTDIIDAISAEYKAEFDTIVGTLAYNTDLQDVVVNAGNSLALATAVSDIVTNFVSYDETDADDQASALTELLRLAAVSADLNADTINSVLIEQYITDITEDINLAASGSINWTTASAADKAAAIQGLINSANSGLDEANRLVAVNEATTVAEMRTALTAVAVAEGTTAYINLSSQAKLEVAELVLVARDAIPVTTSFTTTSDVTTAIGTASAARTNFLSAVNAATDIDGMKTALDGAVFPEFQTLGDLAQVDAAESVLNVLDTLKAKTIPEEFKTITEVKAAAGL
ncbi:Hypothetical protein DPCES_3549 [Desulfitobacterium hafniense]|uniref:Uncharacterized protein n=1 Tax=Desulfitobacterium hafniense TaxID=49338 RepID=A0A098B4Y0_DESHA|nr:Hypothetical protein DPCES_3549 [Desulfitobacterium hafniense]